MAWFDGYLDTLLARDVQDLARIEGLLGLPRLSRLLAARPVALLNHAELSRATGLPQTTLKRYLALLEGVFLVPAGRVRRDGAREADRMERDGAQPLPLPHARR